MPWCQAHSRRWENVSSTRLLRFCWAFFIVVVDYLSGLSAVVCAYLWNSYFFLIHSSIQDCCPQIQWNYDNLSHLKYKFLALTTQWNTDPQIAALALWYHNELFLGKSTMILSPEFVEHTLDLSVVNKLAISSNPLWQRWSFECYLLCLQPPYTQRQSYQAFSLEAAETLCYRSMQVKHRETTLGTTHTELCRNKRDQEADENKSVTED